MKKIFLLSLVVLVVCSSCDLIGERVRGNGNIKTEERTVSAFDRVEVHGNIDVHIQQGDIKPLRIEGDENLIEYVEVIEEGNTLTIRSRRGFNLSPTNEMKVFVTAPLFKSIDVSGSCDIIGGSKLSSTEDLDLEVSGAGDIKMEVDAPRIKAGISGSGSVSLKGETREFELRLSGAGAAHCYDLLSEDTKVDISGAGDAEVYASQKLDAHISGAGTVHYKGNAQNVKQEVSGAGSVNKVN